MSNPADDRAPNALGTPESAAPLRQEMPGDLSAMAKSAAASLRDRLLEQAAYAHRKYRGLSPVDLSQFLLDAECVRFPTQIIYEAGRLARHQFGEPEIDPADPETGRRALYLHPGLASRPDLLRLAVAYLTPVINYGEIVTDDHCLQYGAALLGLTADEFYNEVCALADFVGAEPLYSSDAPAPADPPAARPENTQ